MKISEIILQLSKKLPTILATDLVNQFLEIRHELQTMTLGKATIGKFVETSTQCLQFLNSGNYDDKPSVDAFLKNIESQNTVVSDDLKICLSRIARATYTLRNKRGIAHKGGIDLNLFDLRFMYACSQWIITEFIRECITNDITIASEIISYIQTPVSENIEEIGGRLLIHGVKNIKDEIIICLYAKYPNYIDTSVIYSSLDRRARTSIYNNLQKLWIDKLIHKDSNGYILTTRGFNIAKEILNKI